MAIPEKSLITDEHRAVIGRKSEPKTWRVVEADVRRMQGILEDHDSRYTPGTGLAPGYILAGFGRAGGVEMPRVLPGGLLTQQEWRFTRPFRIEEELTAISQIVDIRDRLGGRYGYSVIVTTGTDYFDSEGNHVAAMMATFTQFDPKAARGEE